MIALRNPCPLRWSLILLCLLSIDVWGQASPPAFGGRVTVELVQLDLVAVDDKGRPVLDLEPSEIRVFEDGQSVELEVFQSPQGVEMATSLGVEGVAEDAGTSPGGSGRAGPSSSLDDVRLLLFVDNVNVGPASRKKALEQIWIFLEERVPATVQIGVASYERSGVSLTVPFTTSRSEILAGLRAIESLSAERLISGQEEDRVMTLIQEIQQISFEGKVNDPCTYIGSPVRSYASTQMLQIQDTVDALTRFVDSLAGLPGRKILIHVSDGIPLVAGAAVYEYAIELCDGSGVNKGIAYSFDYQVVSEGSRMVRFDPVAARMEKERFNMTPRFEKLASHANAQEVTFFTFQASGPRRPSTATADHHLRVASVENEIHRARNLQDTLFLLADETGGRTVLDESDLRPGLDRLMQDLESQYRLAYAAPNAGDGEMHRIEVEVARPGVEVRHRKRYRSKALHEQVADQLASRLLYGVGENPMAIRIEQVSQTPGTDDRIEVVLRVEVPLERLILLPQGQLSHGFLTLFLVARDGEGRRTPIRQSTVPVMVDTTAGIEHFTYDVRMIFRSGQHDIVVALLDEVGGQRSFLGSRLRVRG